MQIFSFDKEGANLAARALFDRFTPFLILLSKSTD
jgi:hypothetical protein